MIEVDTRLIFLFQVLEWQTDEDSDEGVKENILSFSRGVFYLCHESPKLKSNFAFIKLRDKKTRF